MTKVAFCALIAVLFGGMATAEVCEERDGAIDGEAGKVDDHGYEFTFESLLFPAADSSHYLTYCVQNQESVGVVRILWEGPKPGTLFQLPVVSGDRETKKWEKFVGKPTTHERLLRYGKTRSYPYSKDVDTITQASVLEPAAPRIHPVQASPLNQLGYSISDAIGDPDLLEAYFEAFRQTNGGGQFETASFATIWVPVDSEVMAQLASGEEVAGDPSSFVPVSFGARSQVDTESFANSFSVEFQLGPEAFGILAETGLLEGYGVVLIRGPFSGLDSVPDQEVLRAEGDPEQVANGLQRFVFRGETDAINISGEVQLTEWSAILTYDGNALGGISFQRLINP